jgi:hypothetical protein
MEIKLCKDCIFYDGNDICHKQTPAPPRYSLVTGEEIQNIVESWRVSASLQREDGFWDMFVLGTCGEIGRWWKPR